MTLVSILVFIGIFAVIAPLLVVWSGAGNARQQKQAVAALTTALGESSKEKPKPVIDFRRNEAVSSIPWLNKILTRYDLMPRIQKLLNQAEVKWNPGTLILTSVACFAVPAYLIDLRTGSKLLSLLVGTVTLYLFPSCLCLSREPNASESSNRAFRMPST